MAYAGRMPDRSKALTVITVAGLHGMALYGLITGLGVDYVRDAITVLQGHNVPIEKVPPPPPPTVKPIDQAVSRAVDQQPASRPPIALPSSLDIGRPIVMPSGPVVEFPLDPLPGPTVAPPMEKPLFAPRSAHARNDPGSWATTDDYPGAALRRGDQGIVRFSLAIGADGRVTGCQIVGSSGSPELDAVTCRQVTRRARFEPATDGTGARVPGTYAGSVRWVIPQD